MKHETHVVGHVVQVERTTFDIAEDLLGAVITRNDDETVAITHVEDVKGFAKGLSLSKLGCTQGSSTTCILGLLGLLLQECHSLLLGVLAADGSCHDIGAEQQCHDDADIIDSLFHIVSPPIRYDC